MSEKETNIAEAMNLILNGQDKIARAQSLAITKIVQAADILNQTGFEDEGSLVLSSLKEKPISKEASSLIEEEILFEITLDKVLS